ncbi:hypothetical protein ACWZEH_26970 [Streptomyces sp. QTS137]
MGGVGGARITPADGHTEEAPRAVAADGPRSVAPRTRTPAPPLAGGTRPADEGLHRARFTR